MTGRLPNLVVIGAQKSATRWLRDVLNAHPDVAMAGRELEFFNHHYAHGLDWYAKQFTHDPVPVVGEATPGYMMWTDDPRRSAARIDGVLPGVALVALLRNPVDRLTSAFVHHARMGRLTSRRSVFEHVMESDPETDPMGLVSGGWYGRSLEPYKRRFGDRLLVVLQDDVKSEPARVYSRVLAHAGVEPSFRPAGLGAVRHSNRDDVPPQVLAAAKLSDGQRADVYDRFFAEDVQRLASLTDETLSRWEPARGQSPSSQTTT